MKKEELRKALILEKEKYLNKSYEELSKIIEPITYENYFNNKWYQVEIQLIEKNNEYVHISVAVDDGKMLRALLPFSTNFIVYRDGRVKRAL